MAANPDKTTKASSDGRKRSTQQRKSAQQRRSSIIVVIVALAVVVGAGLSWRFSLSNNNEGSTSEPLAVNVGQQAAIETLSDASAFRSLEESVADILIPQEEDEQVTVASLVDFSNADWDSVPTGSQLSTFSLFGDDAPALSDEGTTAIQDAISSAERLGNVSMMFIDANTGLGICYNSDYAIYGASTFKGPYAVYICQDLIENGQASLNTAVSVTSTNTGSISIDSSSSWATSGEQSYPASDLITAAIVNSDNDAYGMLRNQFDEMDYDVWIASLGVEDAPRDPLTWYPTYCTVSSAKLWANALEYFETGTDTATWLSDLFEQTSVSFIRDGISEVEDDDTVVVRNKAGWISDDNPTYNAVNDAGIIEVDGKTYLMCIFTSQPDCTEARDNVSAIAAALYEAREELGAAELADDETSSSEDEAGSAEDDTNSAEGEASSN